jgi:hypothetical protein
VEVHPLKRAAVDAVAAIAARVDRRHPAASRCCSGQDTVCPAREWIAALPMVHSQPNQKQRKERKEKKRKERRFVVFFWFEKEKKKSLGKKDEETIKNKKNEGRETATLLFLRFFQAPPHKTTATARIDNRRQRKK